MEKFEKTVTVKKETILVFEGLLTGEQLRDANPNAHLYTPKFLEGSYSRWHHGIKVKHRNHSPKELRRFLRHMSKENWFQDAKLFNYYYLDNYRVSFKEGWRRIELLSEGHNPSEERKMRFDTP